jgi:carbamoyl-phosphate synthase small subunit
VFSTGMTGYQETLTDPSYHRQVVVMTAPHVGNTGVNDEDPESRRIWVSGYVVRDPARRPSSWRSVRTLDEELAAQGVVGISRVDTRALTRHLRERGAMRVGIFSGDRLADDATLLARVQAAPQMTGADLAGEVATTEAYVVPARGTKRFTVAAVDLGIKGMTPHRMAERGIEVHVLPATATADEVYAVDPDGVFFSNGPGDPAAAGHPVELMRAGGSSVLGVRGRACPPRPAPGGALPAIPGTASCWASARGHARRTRPPRSAWTPDPRR